jgi:hypothetical protein
MNQTKKDFFSTTSNFFNKSTVSTICFVLIALYLVVGCKKDKETSSNIISFMEYSLEGTLCQWTNLDYDNKVIIINSEEELEKYIRCIETNHPTIDFSSHTMLLVSGKTDYEITEVLAKNLLKLSPNKYKLNIEITINTTVEDESKWIIAIIVKKLNEESVVALNVTTFYGTGDDNGDDFSLPRDKYIGSWRCQDADGAAYIATISSDSSNLTQVIIKNYYSLNGTVTAVVTEGTITVNNQKMQDVQGIYWCEGVGSLSKKGETYTIYWWKYNACEIETTSTYTKL